MENGKSDRVWEAIYGQSEAGNALQTLLVSPDCTIGGYSNNTNVGPGKKTSLPKKQLVRSPRRAGLKYSGKPAS